MKVKVLFYHMTNRNSFEILIKSMHSINSKIIIGLIWTLIYSKGARVLLLVVFSDATYRFLCLDFYFKVTFRTEYSVFHSMEQSIGPALFRFLLDLESIGSSLGIDWELIWSGVEWSGPSNCLDNRHLIIESLRGLTRW